jgi:hypothetical protein
LRESFDNPETGERERFEIADPQSALGLKILAQSNASDDGSAGLKGDTRAGFLTGGPPTGAVVRRHRRHATGGTRHRRHATVDTHIKPV